MGRSVPSVPTTFKLVGTASTPDSRIVHASFSASASDVGLSFGAPAADPLAAAAEAAGEAAAMASAGSGIRGQGKIFETDVVLGLAYLFIHSSGKLNAFRKLVPHVFSTHLLLGTSPRASLNEHLAFDPQLERLVTESDDLVSASFFWHGHVQSLFIKSSIDVRSLVVLPPHGTPHAP